MLFHTWPFLVFLLVVLPVYFALRRTPFWLPWLTAASYFFYGWWNPYYLLLVLYSTLLDYCLVALMDHSPPRGHAAGGARPSKGLGNADPVLRLAFYVASAATLGI